FYRGLAFVAYKEGTDIKDEAALVKLVDQESWSVEMSAEKTHVMFRGQDVTEHINAEEIGSLASQISGVPKVRAALLDAQRRCALQVPGLIAEGRDCGTVVFPNALVKIYLTARAEDRAQRRASEQGISVTETQDAQRIRDAQDATRKAAPMQI